MRLSLSQIRMNIEASIQVTLKETVSDPQGSTIAGGLEKLGFDTVQDVRAGKYFQITLEADSIESAEETVVQMCKKLLSNPIIETFNYKLKVKDK